MTTQETARATAQEASQETTRETAQETARETARAYILNPDVALRSWERVPRAILRRFVAKPQVLTPDEFALALRCDGSAPLEDPAGPGTLDGPQGAAVSQDPAGPQGAAGPQDTAVSQSAMANEALQSLLRKGIVHPCEPGAEALTPWQRYRACPNRIAPWMALEITGKCNYNCLHCFNAADNQRLHTQLSLEQIERLLDQASEAGVSAVLLTGGEPLVHPQFRQIVEAVYSRDMFVHELNTNGRFITPELLEWLDRFGFKTEIKISFDGLGFHDWMRNCAGAQEDALRAIRACIEAGFPVRVQTNLNRKNRESMLPTLELMDSMGVASTRIICTTESTRWEMNAAGQTMEWPEYMECALQTLATYAAHEDHTMKVDVWRVGWLEPRLHAYGLTPVRYSTKSFKTSRPCCATVNGMPAIGSDGQLYPCLQCSGYYNAHGIFLGNALESGLLPLLQGGAYYQNAHATVAQKVQHQQERDQRDAGCQEAERQEAGCQETECQEAGTSKPSCATCQWLTWCGGGCPALSTLFNDGDYLAPDPTCCAFFLQGWPQRFQEALPGWRNLTPLD